MLAPAKLPERYTVWNLKYGAPSGRRLSWFERHTLRDEQAERARGPFAIQPNNSTRIFEYPWAFEAGDIRPGLRTLEIGGGLAGLQFVLDQSGCEVTNVDPGEEAEGVGWPCEEKAIAQLNRRFGTHVTLCNTTIDRAGLPDNHFDRAFSISVLEHVPSRALAASLEGVYRCLKPGGMFVVTLDLF
jgi:SAM-dependent methyltransferase